MKTSNSIRVAAVLGTFVAGCSGATPEPTSTKSQAEPLASPTCVQNVLCIRGDHWDPVACACVPDACISKDDGPCGGFVAHPCTCAPGLVCKANRIPDIPGTCEEKRCCPVGWDMYGCKEENGSSGLNCHNPLLGCASSLACGGGCDSEVTGRCPVCDPVPCPPGEAWDLTRCRCEPSCVTAADCKGALPQLCVACPEGGSGCAHFACVASKCEIAYCP